MGIIYLITNNLNKKVYIGKTIRSLQSRWSEHLRDMHNPQRDNKLYRAMNKYGSDNFTIEILEENIPNENLSEKEQYYIKLYNSYYDGYNSTFGGEGESCVDIDLLKEQYLLGKTFSEIAENTGHTRKTVSIRLRQEGYESPCKNSSGNLNKGKAIMYNNQVFNSLTLLAKYLQSNVEEFKDKEISTIVKGISKNTKLNRPYCGHMFQYL